MKSSMNIALLFLLLLAFPAAAETGSASATLSWEHPTERVSGEALPLDALDAYLIEYRDAVRGGDVIEKPVTTEHVDQFVAPYGDLVVEYRIRSRDTFGLLSEWSDWVEHTATVKPQAAPAAIPLNVTAGSGE